MKNTVLQYTFKVWVTSVVVSPFLFGLILLARQIVTVTELLDDGWRLSGIYLGLAVLQLLFSFVTWIVFLLLVNVVSLIPLSNLLIKVIIFCIGILLTIGTFMALRDFISLIGDRDNIVNLMYANCAGIGLSVWYYRLNTASVEREIEVE